MKDYRALSRWGCVRFALALLVFLIAPTIAPPAVAVESCGFAIAVEYCVIHDDASRNIPIHLDVLHTAGARVAQEDSCAIYADCEQTVMRVFVSGVTSVNVRQAKSESNDQDTSVAVTSPVGGVAVGQSKENTCRTWIFTPAENARGPCGTIVPNVKDTAPFPDWPELP